LLKKFGTVENLYEQIEKNKADIPVGLKKKLIDNKDQAFFSKKLATVRYDVPLVFDLDACRVETYNPEEVIKLFQELDFKSLIGRLPVQQQLTALSTDDKSKTDILKDIEKASKDKILSKKVYQLEKDLVPVLEKMEQTGIKLDIDFLRGLSKKINVKIQELEEKIYKLSGVNFNINSSQQLSEILFKKLNIPVDGLRKTPGGVISIAAPELLKLKGKHKIIDLILEFRELMKLKTTYVDTLPELTDKNGRIHTNYHQLGTATGRLSSSDPNLQNIPIRGEWGKDLRKAFIAERGYKLISADYSQIELRIAACLAKDKKMIRAFKDNKDIHKLTAAEVNNISLDKVTDNMRFEAKALNFGVLYGMSVAGFAQAAGISRARAKKFIDEYMHDFIGIAKYVEKTKKEVKKKGYVETALGRRRYLPQINSSDFLMRRASERMAINMPIQGTAADIMKAAMIKIFKSLPHGARLLLQVHDELILEVEEDRIKETKEIVKDAMENVLNEPIFKSVKSIFKVPLDVDIKIGDNWGEMK
jgi:DNA polymerase-1